MFGGLATVPHLDLPDSLGPNWFEEQELHTLAEEVGGREELDALDTRPVPDDRSTGRQSPMTWLSRWPRCWP
jgi:hypothetical protein